MTNNGCKRYCEVMNRPAYIVLFKGDDSDFEGNQSVDIVIDTELDTTGMKAHFRFMDFVQDFDSIPENKTLSLVFPNAKTSEFPLGAADATLRLEDASGKFRTISNRIHIVVTNSVNEAYDNEDRQSITVTVKGTVTWEMIEGKPPIPEPITIDTALSTTSENPVQNKVVSKALYTGFTEWEFSDVPSGYSCRVVGFASSGWEAQIWEDGSPGTTYSAYDSLHDGDTLSLEFEFTIEGTPVGVTATRHLVTPTKTSQLTNDGPSSGPNVGYPFATTNQIPAPVDISGKLDGAAAYPAWDESVHYPAGTTVSHNGRLWHTNDELIGGGTTVETPSDDSEEWYETTLDDLKQDALGFTPENAANKTTTLNAQSTETQYPSAQTVYQALQGKANTSDLPYAIVTASQTGDWQFSGSGVQSGHAYTVDEQELEGYFEYTLKDNGSTISVADIGIWSPSVDFSEAGTPSVNITATRAYALADRTNNKVPLAADSGTAYLQLPPAVPGKMRDLLVRVELATGYIAATNPSNSFDFVAPSTGETVSYEAKGGEMPYPEEDGTYWFSLSESDQTVVGGVVTACKFAVSMEKLEEVS